MEPRKIIRPDIAASAIAHLTLVALIILISEVHPFHAAPAETVAVDIVTPEQVKQEEAKAEEKAREEAREKPPEQLPEFKLPKLDFTDKDKLDTSPKPAPSEEKPAEKAPLQQRQQPRPPQAAKPQEANAQSQPQQSQPQQPPAAMPQPQAAPPAYKQPEPDVTVRYHVTLGLPPALPPAPKDAPKDDGGDAKDSIAAKLPPEVIAELRRHLRSCSKLPAGVAPTDAVRIRLRAVMATDGTLAREPILIEAPPSAKGVAIVKSAISALQNCQPYKMLPTDKYAEWSVMDLSFTPGDFGS
ncbi:hypothetical protein KUL72_16600 [Bradyrhizobium arachidis]|uniref:hypothetical protein n=1 Tax=Bradyrhizobium TaxID=374 RepID=UPI0021635366|nr:MULTISPECIES: hypothetical protein [Bradyrhizobium]MDN4988906.1 hypothetical protein [Bradyrhizobium sp. WYCCWR 13022]UVO39860.1 hypothetical protein KUL72_16600 [Bradyrhizobium arachidis]